MSQNWLLISKQQRWLQSRVGLCRGAASPGARSGGEPAALQSPRSRVKDFTAAPDAGAAGKVQWTQLDNRLPSPGPQGAQDCSDSEGKSVPVTSTGFRPEQPSCRRMWQGSAPEEAFPPLGLTPADSGRFILSHDLSQPGGPAARCLGCLTLTFDGGRRPRVQRQECPAYLRAALRPVSRLHPSRWQGRAGRIRKAPVRLRASEQAASALGLLGSGWRLSEGISRLRVKQPCEARLLFCQHLAAPGSPPPPAPVQSEWKGLEENGGASKGMSSSCRAPSLPAQLGAKL